MSHVHLQVSNTYSLLVMQKVLGSDPVEGSEVSLLFSKFQDFPHNNFINLAQSVIPS